jgi:hypothetical protein
MRIAAMTCDLAWFAGGALSLVMSSQPGIAPKHCV